MAEYFYKDGDEYKQVEDTLLAQADVDKVVESRLERQKKALTSQYADYDTLKEKAGKVDTISKEYQDKLKAEADAKADLEKQLGSAKLDTEKVKAIHEFKLPDDAAEFLTGETADEIRARAEKLSKLPGSGKVVIKKDPKPGEKSSDSAKLAKSLFGPKE